MPFSDLGSINENETKLPQHRNDKNAIMFYKRDANENIIETTPKICFCSAGRCCVVTLYRFISYEICVFSPRVPMPTNSSVPIVHLFFVLFLNLRSFLLLLL